MIILGGMFIYGDRIPASPNLVKSDASVSRNPEDSFCSEEAKKYKKELDTAKREISTLNYLLKQANKQERSFTTYSAE